MLTVSQFHKDQVCDVWGIAPEIVFPITNGIDLSLFEGNMRLETSAINNAAIKEGLTSSLSDRVKLLYSSRPERGLEWLVKPDGIMHKLAEIDEKFHLYVCGYDNTTPQMAAYYDMLWQACDALPNVTRLGALTKKELADAMRQCDAMVYPTPSSIAPNFEEVSCITAMECMAAGLPFISTEAGALPETCKDSGSILLPLEDGLPDVDSFVKEVELLSPIGDVKLKEKQRAAAKRYSWSNACQLLLDALQSLFAEARKNPGSVARTAMELSDIWFLRHHVNSSVLPNDNGILNNTLSELEECYAFTESGNTWREHYEAYYEYEKQRGVDYGPENLDGNDRFEAVCNAIAGHFGVSRVLDYGCAHGHYTINLAKRFPDVEFVGIDITQSNIDKARAWAEADGVKNVRFERGAIEDGALTVRDGSLSVDVGLFNVVLAAEVLEHVADYKSHVDILQSHLHDDGLFLATTPYGPWEAVGYEEHWPWRAHVHHFDCEDLKECFGHLPGFFITCIPSGTRVGSYMWGFRGPSETLSNYVDYDRKLMTYVPRQTVSLCMIAKDAEDTISKALKSAFPFVDEIILHIDRTTSDSTLDVAERTIEEGFGHKPAIVRSGMPSATDIGFDAARNATIREASGDWILWLDADEEMFVTGKMYDMIRNNQFTGYCVPQHHFAIQPLGVIKTDYPCRLFRNGVGMQFFGVVHEHPERALNAGPGRVMVTNELQIVHPAYIIEEVRRERFDRNLPLLVRDREKYPERKLGKFLWLRDLAQMSMRSRERHGRVTKESRERADEGIKIWEELLKDGDLRMVIDGIEFYSMCVAILGEGFAVDTSVAIGKVPDDVSGQVKIKGMFQSTDHYIAVLNLIASERTKDYWSKYYV